MKHFAICGLFLLLAPAGSAIPTPAFCTTCRNLSASVVTKFVPVRHADLDKVADLLVKAFPLDPADEIPLQVVVNHRTREIFLFGPVPKIDLAETVIRAVDTDPPPPELAPVIENE